jgi:hypothetical protein
MEGPTWGFSIHMNSLGPISYRLAGLLIMGDLTSANQDLVRSNEDGNA